MIKVPKDYALIARHPDNVTILNKIAAEIKAINS